MSESRLRCQNVALLLVDRVLLSLWLALLAAVWLARWLAGCCGCGPLAGCGELVMVNGLKQHPALRSYSPYCVAAVSSQPNVALDATVFFRSLVVLEQFRATSPSPDPHFFQNGRQRAAYLEKMIVFMTMLNAKRDGEKAEGRRVGWWKCQKEVEERKTSKKESHRH